MLKIGWFSTGRDQAAGELLRTIYDSIKTGEIKADISFVFCNRVFGESEESDRFLKMVEGYGIDLICFSSRDFEPEMRQRGRKDPHIMEKRRSAYDNKVIKRLVKHRSDLNVLAGYMQIAGSRMCEELDMINLHPAAPDGPSGTWQEVIWKLMDSGVDSSGVMIHLVTKELDKGPPVTYCTFPIKGPLLDKLWGDLYRRLQTQKITEIIDQDGEKNELFMEIRRQGFIRELPLLVQTIKAFADRRIRLENKTLFIGNEAIIDGLCLTKEIEASL